MCSTPAAAQCTVEIPASAIVVNTDTSFSPIGQAVWVCDGGSVNGGSVDPIFFVESGGYLNLSGLNKKVYLQSGATIECSGIGDTIWYETGAVISCSGDHVDILCTDLVFDLSNAPENGCAGTTDIAVQGSPSPVLAFDPATHILRAELATNGPWQVDVSDPLGRCIERQRIAGRTITIQVPETGTGVLIVRLTGPGYSSTQRLFNP